MSIVTGKLPRTASGEDWEVVGAGGAPDVLVVRPAPVIEPAPPRPPKFNRPRPMARRANRRS